MSKESSPDLSTEAGVKSSKIARGSKTPTQIYVCHTDKRHPKSRVTLACRGVEEKFGGKTCRCPTLLSFVPRDRQNRDFTKI